MKSLLLYLLQMIIASGILYGYYHFFLRNKKFHQYNRYYLLTATVISILIPFLHIPVYFTDTDAESSLMIKTLKTIYYSGGEDEVIIMATTGSRPAIDWNTLLYILYGLVTAVLLARILVSLKKIDNIIKTHPAEELNGVHFVNTAEPGTPYSFFRWLFWNDQIELDSEKGQQIFRHEIFHIQQKHSWDVIFMEMIKMIFWINPFFHLIKKEIRAIHEFLADQFAVKEEEKWQYAELLLMQALHTKQNLANPFFHNQIKRRIAMIINPQKTSHRYLRKLLVLPLTAFVITLVAFTYKNKTADGLPEAMTVVIDAGHGGNATGVQSADKKFTEDQIALDLAKTIRSLAGEYNINVVLTRENDRLPGNATSVNEGFQKRVAIAKETGAELFISLHMSSTGTGEQSSRSGFEAYVSSKKEDVRSDQLAAAVLQNLSGIYQADRVVKKRNSEGIFVLDQNVCPAILLECGYINNRKDLAFITSKSNQEKIARQILEALVNYKKAQPPTISLAPVTEGSINSVYTTMNIKSADSGFVGERPSKITLNGKALEIKEIKIEGMENSYIESANIYIEKPYFFGDSSNQPLIVIDGVIQENNSSFKHIDPATIESVVILKNQTATGKYGTAGKHGVIEITTKTPTQLKLNEVVVEGVKKEVVVQGVKKEIVVQGIKKERAAENVQEEVVVQGMKKEIVVQGVKRAPAVTFEKAGTEASFAGGVNEWRKYLERNLNSNVPVDNKAPQGTYSVLLQFMVKTDGSLEDIKALTHHGYGMEEEALRIIKKSPRWNPAMQNGEKVNAYKKQPITFMVMGEDNTTQAPHESLNEVVVVGYATLKAPDRDAAFIGGQDEWLKYLVKNMNPSVPVSNGAPEGTYKTEIQILIKADGTTGEIKALTTFGYGMEEEAIRVIRNVEKWQPAIVDGNKVDAYKKQPVTFVITSESGDDGDKTNVDKMSPIYPNPANNNITIPFSSPEAGNGEVRIMDMFGTVKMTTKTNFTKGLNTLNVNVASLAKGTYVVHIINAGKVAVRVYKMVKQ